jgi:hypothetical protein
LATNFFFIPLCLCCLVNLKAGLVCIYINTQTVLEERFLNSCFYTNNDYDMTHPSYRIECCIIRSNDRKIKKKPTICFTLTSKTLSLNLNINV